MFQTKAFKIRLAQILGSIFFIFFLLQMYIFFFDPMEQAEFESSRQSAFTCVISKVSTDLNLYYLETKKYPKEVEIQNMLLNRMEYFSKGCFVEVVLSGGELIIGGHPLNVDLQEDGKKITAYLGKSCATSKFCQVSNDGSRSQTL